MATYISPASDMFIRYLWGSEKNKDQTLSFINGVMCDSGFTPLISLDIKNPFNLKTFIDDKESILDIKAEDSRGRIYNIEVQATGTTIFRHRSLYYWARLYADQMQDGQSYNTLRPTICINLLNFILFKELKGFHSCFVLREKQNPDYMLTDHLMLHFLELPKFSREKKTSNPQLFKWLYFLLKEGKKEEDEMLKILIRDDEDIRKAHQEYLHFSRDDKMKALYEARHKRMLDEISALEEAEQRGIEKGICGMYQAGVDIPLIANSMEMSVQEIEIILKKKGFMKG